MFIKHAMSTEFDNFTAEKVDLTEPIMKALKDRKYLLRSLCLKNCKSVHNLNSFLESLSFLREH